MLKRMYRTPQRCRRFLCRTCLGECFMCDKLCEFNKYDKVGLDGILDCRVSWIVGNTKNLLDKRSKYGKVIYICNVRYSW